VNGDATRLEQIFANLLGNASKHCGIGCTAHLDLEIEPAGDQPGQAVIHVADDGKGIAPELIDGLFELFTQGDGEAERTGGGLGVGLNLTRRLAELHGGTVEGDSPGLGQGSTFTVRLPTLAEAPPAPTAPAEPTRAKPARVLVVDDNQDAARLLTMLLSEEGHEVHTAFDGQEALRRAEKLHPEIVLLDIGLPGLDGYEAAQELRRQTWAQETLMLALTGWGQEDDRRRSAEAGFDGHLVKPVDLEQLQKWMAAGRDGSEALA
jgi:CheY-like chemotaxis protein